MKALFIAYNQAYGEEIIALLAARGQRGFTQWQDIGGRGSLDGDPHLGSHAWPVMNCALLSVIPDELAAGLMDDLRRKDASAPDLGLRAYLWNVEEAL